MESFKRPEITKNEVTDKLLKILAELKQEDIDKFLNSLTPIQKQIASEAENDELCRIIAIDKLNQEERDLISSPGIFSAHEVGLHNIIGAYTSWRDLKNIIR